MRYTTGAGLVKTRDNILQVYFMSYLNIGPFFSYLNDDVYAVNLRCFAHQLNTFLWSSDWIIGAASKCIHIVMLAHKSDEG